MDGAVPAGPIWALTVLYHPNIELVGYVAVLGALSAGGSIGLSRTSPELMRPRTAHRSPFADDHLSRKPVWLRPGRDGGIHIDVADSSTGVTIRRTTLGEEGCDLGVEELLRGVVVTLRSGMVILLHGMSELGVEARSYGLVGESAGIHRIRRDIRHVADLDLAVLLRGETGTGKELVARAIHEASPRAGGPFVAVNLGALPASLAVVELFGAAAGAYTGAGRGQQGYFAAARGGTLFLDEIGEASPEVQAMLLRALESGEIQGVGAQRAQRSDVRVISATDADLEAKIADQTFRAPLLHRLASYEITLPPLRERRDDLGRLIVHFLREDLARIGDEARFHKAMSWGRAWLPASLVARLADLEWPGNVRQLRNVIRQLVVGSRGVDHVQITPPVERLLEEATNGMVTPLPRRRSPASSIAPPPSAPSSGEPLSVEPLSMEPLSVEPLSVEPPSVAPLLVAPPPVAGLTVAPPPAVSPLDDLPTRPSPGDKAAAPRRRPSEVTEDEIAAALREAKWELAAAATLLRISRASLYVLIENNPRFRTAGDLTAEEIVLCHQACGGDLQRMSERLEVSPRALQRRVRELSLD